MAPAALSRLFVYRWLLLLAALVALADGDGRYLLNLVEEIATLKPATPLDSAALIPFAARTSSSRQVRSPRFGTPSRHCSIRATS